MYLGAVFSVFFDDGIVPDGTEVDIRASNSVNENAQLRNNHSTVRHGRAEFKDLRFVGKSGRGKKFNVYIVVKTQPQELVIVYPDAIKVTVDGPRPPRNSNSPPPFFFFSMIIFEFTAASGRIVNLSKLELSDFLVEKYKVGII
jgi:hypothetical protein